ncbi:phosphatidylinositol N-acetylglucosaminyltransferase subunit Q [Trichonephila clavipes]|nr:phosphatidylinositol N-acetylglucosaminyltransferase subunit Q [Trichonephila clavipes]
MEPKHSSTPPCGERYSIIQFDLNRSNHLHVHALFGNHRLQTFCSIFISKDVDAAESKNLIAAILFDLICGWIITFAFLQLNVPLLLFDMSIQQTNNLRTGPFLFVPYLLMGREINEVKKCIKSLGYPILLLFDNHRNRKLLTYMCYKDVLAFENNERKWDNVHYFKKCSFSAVVGLPPLRSPPESLPFVSLRSHLGGDAIGACTYMAVVLPVFTLILKISILIGILGATFVLCLLSDLVSLATIHIYCFYGYAARLYGYQIIALSSLWRLFRGKKWNPLRQRVDSYTYDIHQLFLGTFIFTVLLFLLPTVLIYYCVFTCLRILVLIIQGIISKAIHVINVNPIYCILSRIIRSPEVAGDIYFSIFNTKGTLTLSMEVIQVSFMTVIKQTLPELSNNEEYLTWKDFLSSIITIRIYPTRWQVDAHNTAILDRYRAKEVRVFKIRSQDVLINADNVNMDSIVSGDINTRLEGYKKKFSMERG